MLACSIRHPPLTILILTFLTVGCTGDEQRQVEGAAGAGVDLAARCHELGEILGSAGNAGDGICRVTFPRSDLSVTLLGASLPTGMGLTSWAAFGPAGERGAIVMGDLALTSQELPRVMAGFREQGIEVTAAHRHMTGETPTMSFIHYLGIGDPIETARALRAALDRAPGSMGSSAGSRPGASTGDAGAQAGTVAGVACSEIAAILGADPQGAQQGPGYCKPSIARTDFEVKVDGIPVSASMGIGSWFAFRQTPDGQEAVIAGDLALTERQVNPAIEALTARDIDVVALHNHMLLEEPRVMFFHFQARGEPRSLAEALRAGLEAAAPGERRAPAGS